MIQEETITNRIVLSDCCNVVVECYAANDAGDMIGRCPQCNQPLLVTKDGTVKPR